MKDLLISILLFLVAFSAAGILQAAADPECTKPALKKPAYRFEGRFPYIP